MKRICTILIIAAGIAGVTAVQPDSADASSRARVNLLKRMNLVRAAHGLPPFRHSKALRKVAYKHNVSMMRGRYFAHTSPSGSTLHNRIVGSGFVTGYTWLAGENLAWGTGQQKLPKSVVRAWMNSPTHRANLLTRSFRYVGISRYCGTFLGHEGACVWTVDYVGRS